MNRCSHCNHPVVRDAPYCPECGQPRMLESLSAPRERPSWQGTLWNVAATLGVVLFLVSSSVAFLREAKAVRVAREALGSNQPALDGRAAEILDPFLDAHPRHEEGLLLAAVARARSDDLETAAARRTALEGVNPDRMDELDPKLERIMDDAVLDRGCDARRLLGYYDAAGVLGESFRSRVLAGLQQAVRRCQREDQERQADALMAGLQERGVGTSLVEETYLEPLRRAVDKGHWEEAERLTRGAARFSTETGEAADEILTGVRQKVEASRQSVDAACRSIRTAPDHRVGRYWCFPKTAPARLAEARDGWGRALWYRALELDPTLKCHQGFEVVSYGADGEETAEPTGGPDTDLVCRFQRGRTSWQLPERFWRP